MNVDASIVYNCLIDYQNHHFNFLPPSFVDYKVEQGGVGTGTIVSFGMRVAGRTHPLRVRIEERVPRREFCEISLTNDLVTFFAVDPTPTGCRVSFRSNWSPARGIAGLLERWLVPAHVGRVFEDELSRLAAYAAAVTPP